MRIEVVQLENIRSHVKSTVPFTRGFNCLVGGLGCGKTSILYSIDFALFGDPVGRSFEYLLREGADSGKVTIQFTQNGNTYILVRGLKRRGKGITQDVDTLKLFHDEKLIASMKTDAVEEQIRAITGLNKDLWREIIWIRQEHLKELIDAAPRDRQKRLDELFGLSDYETAWSNIVEYQRQYDWERKQLEKDPDVTGREKLADEYNRVTEEYTLIEIELSDYETKLAAAKRRLEESDQRLKQLEEKKLAFEELRRKEVQIATNLKNAQRAVSDVAERIEGKKTVLETLQQREASMGTQIKSYRSRLEQAGIPSGLQLEEMRHYLVGFDDRISSLRAEQEATLRAMQTDQKRVAQLATETDNKCPLCLQPLNDEYKEGMIERIELENKERQKTIAELQREILGLQRTKMASNDAFSSLQTLTSRAEDLKARLEEEEQSIMDLYGEMDKKQRIAEDLSDQLKALQAEISCFDLSDLDAARKQREQAFRLYYSIESEFKTKENRKGDLLHRLDEIKERVDLAQEKVERMEQLIKAIQIIGAIRDAYRSIQPKLRSEFVKVLRNFVQQVLDSLAGGEAPMLNIVIDENYTPYVKSESGSDREVANLSGGERTILAFAYRLGLGQLIMQSRTGHGLGMLLLDEPTENLGTEDGSISRLAEAISRFKAIEQIIAVTHSEEFAEKAEHVIVLEKEAGISKVSIAKNE